MNKYKIPIVLIVFGFLVSCGSRRGVTETLPAEDAAIARVIANHYENEADFETLQGRLGVQFQNEETNQSVTVSFRMKKGDTIWMSGRLLGFPLAKVMITPNSVQYYERISQTYFDGNFSLLSNLLGTPLDFQKIQNLLIGQAVYDLREERYELTDSSRGYELAPSEENFLKKMFLLDAGNYKALAQQIAQEDLRRSVIITYPEYQDVEGRIFPEEIKIVANEGNSSTLIDLEFRSLEFDVPVSFPFSIPSGYEEISVE